MPTDDILIRFKADTGQLKAEFDELQANLKKSTEEQRKAGAQSKVTSKEIEEATKRRNVLLSAEINVLKQLEQQQKKAFTPKDIKEFNDRIAQSQKNISLLKGESDKLGSGLSSLGFSFAKLGGFIAAAFSVQQIIAFNEASFKAFTDAEKVAKILQTAVGVNGGLQSDFEALTKQAIELQKQSIFSDEAIKSAQTMALQFGLTTKQVEQLIPTIVDFASATGQTLESALDAVLHGTEGMARGLKVYGIEVDKTGTKQEKLASITKQLTDKFSGQAEVVGKTTFGAVEKLKNQFNDFQESVGEFIAQAGEATAVIIEWVANGFKPLDDALDKTGIKLDAIGKQIADAFPKIQIEAQIANLKKLGEAVPQQLTDALNKINFDKFNEEIQKLDDKGLIQKLNELEAANEEFQKNSIANTGFAPTGILKEQLDAINSLIASRKVQNKLLTDQNKESDAEEQKRLAFLEELRKRFANAEAAQEEDDTAKKQAELQKQFEDDIAFIEKGAKEKIISQKDTNDILLRLQDSFVKGKQAIDDNAAKDQAKKQQELNKAQAEKDFKITLASVDEQEQTKIAAIEKDFATRKLLLEKNGKLTALAEIELESKKEAAILQIHLDALKQKQNLNEDDVAEVKRLQAEIEKITGESQQKQLESFVKTEEEKRKELLKTFDAIGQASQAFTDILNANTEAQIQSLTDAQQAQTDSFDKQKEHLQALFDTHRISQEEFDKRSKALAKSREKAEKDSQERIKALKLEEAKREKNLAIFTIALDIAKHLAAIPTDFVGAAIAAAQLIAVTARPLPTFAKGTKGKQGSGLALVGEKGAELTFLPSQAKVLPAQKTKQYSDIIDSMFDGRLDEYIHKNYVLPALKLQSPNVNINIDYKKLAKANKQRDSISIDNLHELAEIFDHNPRRVI